LGTRIPDSQTEKPQTKRSDLPVSSSQPSGRVPVVPNGAAALGKSSAAVKAGLPLKTAVIKPESPFPELNLPLSNTPPQNSLLEKSAGTSGNETILAQEVFRQISSALGFPQDTLSITLVAFLRFFSISPDPLSFKTLRREILTSLKTSSPGSTKEKAALEAKALALVSAFDKGVNLSQEALEKYARSLEPMAFAGNGETAEENTITLRDNEEECSLDENPDAEELRIIAQKQSQDDNFFDLLNSLPGKNGIYWKVFPFKIRVRGTELKVFLRLLKREPLCPGQHDFVIVDITGSKRQWRCLLGHSGGELRADIRIYPGLPDRDLKLLLREAETFLGKGSAGKEGTAGNSFIEFGEIRVRNGEELPSWMEELCNESLPSINEEV